MSLLTTSPRLVARNTILNFLGQCIPLFVGIATIPPIIRGLGVESFGILSLAWMLLGYFTVFDLGLGRATTKFISAHLGKGSTEDIRSLFWTSCWMNLFLGVAGGLVIAVGTPFLVHRVFRIPPSLFETAGTTFYILAASCPIVLVSTAFRGTLEAAQRFEYVNAVAVASSSLVFLIPLVGVLLGFELRGIVLFLMIARLGSALVYFILCIKVFPELRQRMLFDRERLRELLTYGGWVSVSNVVNPVLVYLDRFIIGSAVSMAAVALYTAPYEMIVRLSILPTSLAMALFPSFSSLEGSPTNSVLSLYSRAVKLLVIIIGPLVGCLILFSRDILHLWLGTVGWDASITVFQILAAGVLMNALAQIPFALIQGFGRPDITAKFHLIELLMYAPLVWILVKDMGIAGGALAWTVRVTLDSLLLFAAPRRVFNLRLFHGNNVGRGIGLALVVMGSLLMLLLADLNLLAKVTVTASVFILCALVSWNWILDIPERELITSAARSVLRT